MSSYIKPTINPDTHEVEKAEWLDDYFGSHNYGVRFPSTGIVYRADEYYWEDDANQMAKRGTKHQGGTVTREQTDLGKRINIMEHDNGRKDVTIQVQSLDVDLSDPSNIEAKRVIEEEIMPAIANAQIIVTVIYKPTNEAASFVCSRKNVRDYAEKVVVQRGGDVSEYCLVQHDGENVTVTTL